MIGEAKILWTKTDGEGILSRIAPFVPLSSPLIVTHSVEVVIGSGASQGSGHGRLDWITRLDFPPLLRYTAYGCVTAFKMKKLIL